MTAVEPAPSPAEGGRSARSLIIVAGSGRSGTSLVSGLLKRLGARVPQPEVHADESNPRGFAESQWVVDFHTKLLRRARMHVSDARPVAWTHTASIAMDREVQAQVRTFLRQQFNLSDDVLVKDPRMTWFLPLWRRVAAELDATPRVIMMLRHPAAVVTSKQTHYGGAQGETSRTAEWINLTLFTERATREVPRAFLRYTDLLEDWTSAIGGVSDSADLAIVRDAPAPAIRAAHEFLDVELDRSSTEWGASVPIALRELAEAVWTEISSPAPSIDRLDELRASYTKLYTEAEGIAFSSVLAGLHNPLAPRRPLPPGVRRMLQRIPDPVLSAVPPRLRNRLLRVARR